MNLGALSQRRAIFAAERGTVPRQPSPGIIRKMASPKMVLPQLGGIQPSASSSIPGALRPPTVLGGMYRRVR